MISVFHSLIRAKIRCAHEWDAVALTKRAISRLLAAVLATLVATSWAEEVASLGEIKQLVSQGQYKRALPRLDEYLEAHPDDAEARFVKGLVLVEADRPDEALLIFRRLTDDHPELPEPHNNLAVLYAAKGDYSMARESLLMAIKTHPTYETAHENLGDIYARMAGIAYGKAVQIDIDNDTAQAKLAMVRELFSARGPGSAPGGSVVPAAVSEE